MAQFGCLGWLRIEAWKLEANSERSQPAYLFTCLVSELSTSERRGNARDQTSDPRPSLSSFPASAPDRRPASGGAAQFSPPPRLSCRRHRGPCKSRRRLQQPPPRVLQPPPRALQPPRDLQPPPPALQQPPPRDLQPPPPALQLPPPCNRPVLPN